MTGVDNSLTAHGAAKNRNAEVYIEVLEEGLIASGCTRKFANG